MKTLHLEDFYGTTGESIEAWLATIPQEVERQAGLGGDTWTAEELYYGVTAHLKDSAGKWFTTLSETMQDDDKTLSYLVRRLRQKYGSRDNLFKTQQKLAAREQQAGERLSEFAAHLTNIGFGKRVPAESYVEAFINGINNPTTATQVGAYEPQTLDALQFAEDKCGLYGEGFNVTDWRVAKRRYREDRELGDDEEEAPPPKRRTSTAAALEQLHWKKLGFGLGGGDSPPKFDDGGNEVSDLERTAKKGPFVDGGAASLNFDIWDGARRNARLEADDWQTEGPCSRDKGGGPAKSESGNGGKRQSATRHRVATPQLWGLQRRAQF